VLILLFVIAITIVGWNLLARQLFFLLSIALYGSACFAGMGWWLGIRAGRAHTPTVEHGYGKREDKKERAEKKEDSHSEDTPDSNC